MTPDQLDEQANLTKAVEALIVEVKSLGDKLSMYAPREEVRRDGIQRAWRFLGFAVVIILIAQSLTMTTISYCFLNVNANAHAPCTLMPGYREALEQADIRNKRYEFLRSTLSNNQLEITKLQAEIERLKKEK